jgi:hypothetical protein
MGSCLNLSLGVNDVGSHVALRRIVGFDRVFGHTILFYERKQDQTTHGGWGGKVFDPLKTRDLQTNLYRTHY